MPVGDMLLRLGASLSLGALIGLERQIRVQRAGLRTNTLVAVGSTLFVLLSAYGFVGAPNSTHDADPTRVAAQIVSGVGFLGGGVILREGFTVRGLDTAATLWCSAAVGALAGAAQYPTAAAGALIVLAANIVLRWVVDLVDQRVRPSGQTAAVVVGNQAAPIPARSHTGRDEPIYPIGRHQRRPRREQPPAESSPAVVPPTRHDEPANENPPPPDSRRHTTMHGGFQFNYVTFAHPETVRTPQSGVITAVRYVLITAATIAGIVITAASLASTIHPHPPPLAPSDALTEIASRVEQCETQHHLTAQSEKRSNTGTIDFTSCAWPPPGYADADGFTDITVRPVPGPGEGEGAQDSTIDRITGPCRIFRLAYDSAAQGTPQHLPPFSAPPGLITSLHPPGAPRPPILSTLGFFPDRNEVDVVHDGTSTLADATCQH